MHAAALDMLNIVQGKPVLAQVHDLRQTQLLFRVEKLSVVEIHVHAAHATAERFTPAVLLFSHALRLILHAVPQSGFLLVGKHRYVELIPEGMLNAGVVLYDSMNDSLRKSLILLDFIPLPRSNLVA